MYAVIKTGGKQYKVTPGDKLKIELMLANIGDTVSFDQVLMVVTDQGETHIGNPNLAGTNVSASVTNVGRHKKVRIFKMRRRKHYQRHQGHRQYYTEVQIDAINHS